MKKFIKFVMISVMMMVAISCNRATSTPPTDDTSTPTDTLITMDSVVNEPLAFELQFAETFLSPDGTQIFKLLDGCVVYVNYDDNPSVYDALNKDILNDNEDYREVLVRMGKLNDGTEVVGYMNVSRLSKHKKVR